MQSTNISKNGVFELARTPTLTHLKIPMDVLSDEEFFDILTERDIAMGFYGPEE